MIKVCSGNYSHVYVEHKNNQRISSLKGDQRGVQRLEYVLCHNIHFLQNRFKKRIVKKTKVIK